MANTGNDTRVAMLRESFQKARENAEEEPVETPPEETEPETPAAESEAAAELEKHAEETPEKPEKEGQSGRDAQGRFAAKPEKPEPTATAKPKPGAKTETAPPKPGAVTATKPPAPAAATETKPPEPGSELKAPQSWTATAREAWENVPPVARQEIHRLEGETRRVLQENAGLRKSAGEAAQLRQGVEQLIAPVSGFFVSEGLQPAQGLANLVGTYAALHGPQRNQVLAALITQYGDLEGINAALQGQPQAAQPFRQPQPTASAPSAVDPREIVRQEIQAAREKAEADRADGDLQAFMATNPEFVRDVWPDMMAILDSAHQNRRNLTYQQAYDRACKMNEDVSAVLARRAEVEAATAAAGQPSAAPAQRARAAAATVRPKPAGGVGAPPAEATDRASMLRREFQRARGQ